MSEHDDSGPMALDADKARGWMETAARLKPRATATLIIVLVVTFVLFVLSEDRAALRLLLLSSPWLMIVISISVTGFVLGLIWWDLNERQAARMDRYVRASTEQMTARIRELEQQQRDDRARHDADRAHYSAEIARLTREHAECMQQLAARPRRG